MPTLILKSSSDWLLLFIGVRGSFVLFHPSYTVYRNQVISMTPPQPTSREDTSHIIIIRSNDNTGASGNGDDDVGSGERRLVVSDRKMCWEFQQ